MDPSLQNAPTIARGVLYVVLGIILILHALNIITGNFIQYSIALAGIYFIVYGIISSGFYERVLHLISKSRD